MRGVKRNFFILLGLLSIALVNSSAVADTVTLASAPNRQGSGGEYIATFTGGILGGTSFNTFCIEFNETLAFGVPYNYVVNPAGAVNGGVAGGNPDPISIGTAWLYNQFLNNQLASYGEPTATGTQQEAFQKAIWWLENEQTSHSGLTTTYLNAALTALGLGAGNYEALRANGNGAYGVVAVNLTQGGTHRQDILARVPEPSATLLLAICLVGIGWFAHRKKIFPSGHLLQN